MVCLVNSSYKVMKNESLLCPICFQSLPSRILPASPSSSLMVTGNAEAADIEQEEAKDIQGQNSKDLNQETSLSSESMVTEQVDVEKPKESVQDVLEENPAATQDVVQMDPTQPGQVEQNTQLERDGSVEAQVECVTAEENERMETNIEHVADAPIVAVNDSTNISEQEGNVKCTEPVTESMETDQLTVKEDCVTQEVTVVTSDQSDNHPSSVNISEQEGHVECTKPLSQSMETNQLAVKEDCVTQEVTVVTSDQSDNHASCANISEQEGHVECTEPSSETMETNQLTVKEDCVTQEVTVVTPDRSDDHASRDSVTEGEMNDKVVGSELSDGTVGCISPGPSDEIMPQVSVAMEIDNQGENSDTSSLKKLERPEHETPSRCVKESATVPNSGSNQPLNSGEAETSLIIDNETAAGYDENESLVQPDNKSADSGLSAGPTTTA